MNGYVMRIYRNAQPAPEVDNWGSLFVDSLKLMIIGRGYAIPIFILYAIICGSIILAVLSGSTGNRDSAMIAGWAPNIGLVLLMFLQLVTGKKEESVGFPVELSLIPPNFSTGRIYL
jgi:hypothetical protein